MKKIAWLLVFAACLSMFTHDTEARRRCKNKWSAPHRAPVVILPVQFDWVIYPYSTSVKIVWTSSVATGANLRIDTKAGSSWQYHLESGTDSTTHYIGLAGLSPATEYKFATTVWYQDHDDSIAYCDSMTFFTTCPTVTISNAAAQAITPTGATLHFHTDQLATGFFKYTYAPYDSIIGWIYGQDADADSLQHTISVTALAPNTPYYWTGGAKYAGCSTTDYFDWLTFTTLTACPSITKSGFATQDIGATGARLHLLTDYACHVGYRFHVSGNNPWIYRHDADADSLAHSIFLAGGTSLLSGTYYTWETNTKYTACDSTGYGDSIQFFTLCPTIVKNNFATQAITNTTAVLHFHAGSTYAVHAGFRYHETGNHPWIYRHDADADSLQHTITIADLTMATTYTWCSNAKKVNCDSTAYGDSTSFTTTCTMIPSGFATQAMDNIGHATLHLHTDLLCNVHYRYSKVTPESWVYRKDVDADSIEHTISLAGLSPLTDYKWQVRFKYSTCDSTGYGNQQTFTMPSGD